MASRKPLNVANAVEQLKIHGGKVLGLQADVRDFEAVGQAFASAHASFGEIDVLVSGAAGNFLGVGAGQLPFWRHHSLRWWRCDRERETDH